MRECDPTDPFLPAPRHLAFSFPLFLSFFLDDSLLLEGTRANTSISDYNCNWLGGQVVAEEIDAPGYKDAGFVNITTSDGVVHGQVRQSELYSFVRIYESGHEVPFYQPLASLELFERVLARKDIATGKKSVSRHCGYKTEGPPTSDYRQGNATIVMDVLPSNATYNTTLNGPNPLTSHKMRRANLKREVGPNKKLEAIRKVRRSMGGKRLL